MSPENLKEFYEQQIYELELAISETRRAKGKGDMSIKQMEKAKKSFEAKLAKIGSMKKDEDNIDFESLGVDSLFVDEAHSYKNLFYTTNMQNVSGLGNRDGSQKSFDLYMKVRYLQKLNNGRARSARDIVFRRMGEPIW
jgi:N12 class adenine-specific DNA methylase